MRVGVTQPCGLVDMEGLRTRFCSHAESTARHAVTGCGHARWAGRQHVQPCGMTRTAMRDPTPWRGLHECA
eukprot:278782-Chlamydomonas_euryale.AAC.1